MKTTTIFFFGPWFWWKAGEEWRSANSEDPSQCARFFAENSADALILYEPDGFGHERIPGWYRNRSEFCESLRNRERFPVLERSTHAWAFDSTHPESALAAETFVHTEARARLASWVARSRQAGFDVPGAWSLFSVCLSIGRSPRLLEAGAVVLVACRDFIGVGLYAQDRSPCSFKSWSGPQNDQVWRSVLGYLRELRAAPECTGSEAESARHLMVYSHGEVLASSGRLSAWDEAPGLVSLLGFDDLAAELVRLKRSHSSNLTQSFPRPINLLPILRASLAAGCALLLTSLLLNWQWCKARETECVRVQEDERRLRAREAHLLENKAVIESNHELVERPLGIVLDTIEKLGSALPVETSLTAIKVDGSGLARVEGLCALRLLPVQDLTRALGAAGLIKPQIAANGASGDWSATGQIPGVRRAE